LPCLVHMGGPTNPTPFLSLVRGPDGIAIFDALHRRGTVSEAMLYAFGLLERDGEDLRDMPLGDRKKRLAGLLGRRRIGIGALLFVHACRLGLEGIVSKRLSASYRSGRSTEWLKIKNPNSPAMVRHREDRWQKRDGGRHHVTQGRPEAAFCVGIGRRLRLAFAHAPGAPPAPRTRQRPPQAQGQLDPPERSDAPLFAAAGFRIDTGADHAGP
jgi:hypothetical protein